MRRSIAIALALGLVSASAASSALHIHLYTDHDHDHHHGPAVHQHAVTGTHGEGHAARLEGCDPGRHTIGLTFVCGTEAQPPAVGAESVGPAIPLPDVASNRAAPVTDIRVHGPPPGTQAPPRAPPLSVSA